MVLFDNSIISIYSGDVSGYLLAENVSISSKNAVRPIYSLGRHGIINQSPDGPIENTFRFTYYVNVENEPIITLIDTLKTLTGSHTGVILELKGLTGYECYLINYSFDVSPNELIKANANFISYKPLSGNLMERLTGETIPYVSGVLGIGWTTHILSGDSYLTAPIYSFNYNFDVQWEPVYLLGSKYPSQVEFIGAVEKMNFVRDVFINVAFSGDLAAKNNDNTALLPAIPSDQSLNIMRYDFIGNTGFNSPSVVISVSGAKIISSNTEAKIDDFIKTRTEIAKYY